MPRGSTDCYTEVELKKKNLELVKFFRDVRNKKLRYLRMEILWLSRLVIFHGAMTFGNVFSLGAPIKIWILIYKHEGSIETR